MRLYKYAHADRLDILRDECIRFTQASALNDPFEMRPYFESIAPESMILEHLNSQSLDLKPLLKDVYNKLPEDQRSQVSLDSFCDLAIRSLNTPEGQKAFHEVLAWALRTFRELTPWVRSMLRDGFVSKFGILSLARTPDNNPMWSHYADQHRGIVLVLDSSHPWFNRSRGAEDEFFHVREVIYQAAGAGKSMIDLNGVDVFLRKDPKWAYEEEVRIVAPVQMAQHVASVGAESVYLFSMPSSAVLGVILGTRSPVGTRAAVKLLATEDPRYSHLEVSQAVLDDERGQILISRVGAEEL